METIYGNAKPFFIKEDAEKQFASQADQKFINDVTSSLLENTKLDLPAAFFKKWI